MLLGEFFLYLVKSGRIPKSRTCCADENENVQINAGAFTHQSIALRDALNGVSIPFVEVHISNVYKREPFRHKSYLSDVAVAVICGMGPYGYIAAVEFCVNHM